MLAFMRRALRHWYVLPATLLVGGLVCAGYFVLQPPAYRSETLLLHTDGIASADATEQATAPRNIAARIQEILMSRQLLGRVRDDFGLYPEVRRQYGPVDAVDELRKHIQFKAPGGNTFRIAFDGDSAQQAQRVTARLAELVIDSDSELRSSQALLTRDFLAREKTGTEGRLDEAERQVASFMAEHPRFALDTTPLTSGAAIRASVQGTARAAPRWTAVPRAATPPPAPMAAATPAASPRGPSLAMRETAASLAAARTSLAEKLAQFTPAHPDVRAAQAAVARAEARFAEAEAADEARVEPTPPPPPATAAPAPSERAMRYTMVPVRDAGPGTTAAPQDLVALETEWATLTRSVLEARQHQDQVEAALFKAEMATSSVTDGNHGTQMSVIDGAYLPQRPVPPGRATIAAIASALSLLLGGLVMLLCAALDDRIYAERDLAGVAGMLVQVPRVRRWRRAHVAT
jgi:uncharacterized protein involved in exopolysaccharide biosynthesis